MKNPDKKFKQPDIQPPVFDGYNKELPIQQALGSARTKSLQEVAEIRSVNFLPGVSGWRLTPLGLEFGSSSGVFPPGSILFVDIQNISTDRLLGRDTAGSGAIEQLTIGGGLEFTGSGGIQRSALTGDVTATAGSGATTIANDAVSNAKLANMANATIKGRTTAGTGDPEDLTAAQVKAILAIASTDVSDFTEAAQDATGAMLDASLTYTDGTPLLAITSAYKRKSLFDHFADVGNVGTGEDDLYSDTIAAGQLANNGEKLHAEYAGTFVTSGGTATRQIRIYFGGTAVFDTGAILLTGAAAWNVSLMLIRVSASVVRAMVTLTTQNAPLAAYTSYTEVTGLTLANTQVLKITGEAAGAGAATDDIVAKLSRVEWIAAA